PRRSTHGHLRRTQVGARYQAMATLSTDTTCQYYCAKRRRGVPGGEALRSTLSKTLRPTATVGRVNRGCQQAYLRWRLRTYVTRPRAPSPSMRSVEGSGTARGLCRPYC